MRERSSCKRSRVTRRDVMLGRAYIRQNYWQNHTLTQQKMQQWQGNSRNRINCRCSSRHLGEKRKGKKRCKERQGMAREYKLQRAT